MKYKVIKEFPGLSVGSVLTIDEDKNYYISTNESVDVSENKELVSINTVVFSKEIVENNKDFFEPMPEEIAKEEPTTLDSLINEIAQVASILESDLIMATNVYHVSIIEKMLNEVYEDLALLNKLL